MLNDYELKANPEILCSGFLIREKLISIGLGVLQIGTWVKGECVLRTDHRNHAS